MKEEVKNQLISHMMNFGLHMIGKGLANIVFAEYPYPYTHSMAVIHITHGVELIIKSRIAQEHPLLIFSKYPQNYTLINNQKDLSELIENVQTIQYSELPERLKVVTGYEISDLNLFRKYGKLRNQIIHFAIPPNKNISFLSFHFIFKIVEKMVNDWWGDSVLNYGYIYDDCFIEYICEQLARNRINLKDDYIRWLKDKHSINLYEY